MPHHTAYTGEQWLLRCRSLKSIASSVLMLVLFTLFPGGRDITMQPQLTRASAGCHARQHDGTLEGLD
jgi:hypothetical protein